MPAIAIGLSPVIGAFVPTLTYTQRILALSPIAYWPLAESSGTTADNAEGTAARDGTYARDVSVMGTGAGPDGENTVPDFDGTNDVIDIETASLEAAWNKNEVSLSAWMKVSGAGVWTDATFRYIFNVETAGSADRWRIYKSDVDNNLTFLTRHGGTTRTTGDNDPKGTGWIHVGLTSSIANDEFIGYLNGSVVGTLDTLGTPSVNAFNEGAIGDRTTGLLSPWDGYIAHVAVFDKILTPAQMLALATV